MRYLHWDVLLFPETSKIPMQEFKTGCYVVSDPEILGADGGFSMASRLSIGKSLLTRRLDRLSSAQIPTVACFVANQIDGFPFRASLHCWEHPVPSPELQFLAQQGKVICFEARVFIDGMCVAGMLFLDRGPWPQVIETSSFVVDKNGRKDHLRWPRFHPEMLTQSFWNAGENMGRIKVTITEGYLNNPGVLPFTRTKNLVTFSFQHAPLHILENAGIAWPHAGLWYQPAQPLYPNLSPSKGDPAPNDVEMHAHSPRRRTASINGVREALTTSIPSLANLSRSMRPPSWNPASSMPDPFVENSHRFIRGQYAARSTDSDQPVLDYSRPITPLISTHTSLDCLGKVRSVDVMAGFHDPYSEPATTFRPEMSSGTAAPASTRTSSVAHTPSMYSKLPGTFKVCAGPYHPVHDRALPTSVIDTLPQMYERSDASTRSHLSGEMILIKSETDAADMTTSTTGATKDRKESQLSELDFVQRPQKKFSVESIDPNSLDKENINGSTRHGSVPSDSKKKRPITLLELHDSTSPMIDNTAEDATRRACKRLIKGARDSPDRADTGTTCTTRGPLGSPDDSLSA